MREGLRPFSSSCVPRGGDWTAPGASPGRRATSLPSLRLSDTAWLCPRGPVGRPRGSWTGEGPEGPRRQCPQGSGQRSAGCAAEPACFPASLVGAGAVSLWVCSPVKASAQGPERQEGSMLSAGGTGRGRNSTGRTRHGGQPASKACRTGGPRGGYLKWLWEQLLFI